MGWSRIFKGEPMPDKNDPKYRERYEREVNFGRRFADKTGISWLSRKFVSHRSSASSKGMYLPSALLIPLFLAAAEPALFCEKTFILSSFAL